MNYNFSQATIKEFSADLAEIKKDIYGKIGTADFKHLKKIERLGRFFTTLGYLTAWLIPNPLSAFALSLGQFTRWLIAHHVLHRG